MEALREDSIYKIICINENHGEYGIEKIGTQFIVARGALAHCTEILKLIDPEIIPDKESYITSICKYIKNLVL